MANKPGDKHTDIKKSASDVPGADSPSGSERDAAHQDVYGSVNSKDTLDSFRQAEPRSYGNIHAVELIDSEVAVAPIAPIMQNFVKFPPELEKIIEPYLNPQGEQQEATPRGLDHSLKAKDHGTHHDKAHEGESHVISKGASEEHRERVQHAYDGIRPNVRKYLEKHHVKVVAVGMMHDEMGEAAKEHPRDYPPGYTWDHTDGGSLNNWTTVAVAEHYRSGAVIADSERVEGVTRHETGHCLDQAMGYFSHGSEFDAAFQKDLANMPPDVRKKLEYFIQGGSNAGKEETFAEIFAMLNGGGSHAKLDPALASYFKNTINTVWAKIYNLK